MQFTHCQKPLPVFEDEFPALQWNRTAACIESLENRRGEAKKIERISNQTLPLLEEICDHIDDQPRVNRAIARIDELRREMNALGRTYDLVTQLTQTTELARFQADRKIAAAKLDGIERQRGQVKRDIDNVRGVAAAAKEFQALMDEVIDRMTRQKQAA